MNDRHRLLSRRQIMAAGALAATGLAGDDVLAQQGVAPTLACHDGDEPTIPETEGPFFKPRSPQRGDLREPGIAGRPVELSGRVLMRSCQPVAGALVDLWHANDRGEYDNHGFRLRGHLFTDNEGWYVFHTIMPGLYTGRTRHYHVKVQAPGQAVLTTQFYFPNEKQNRADPLFRRELLMQVRPTDAEDALLARFDVVLELR
jgi:protocatechuate 3,4-dioxygenase beta subunit